MSDEVPSGRLSQIFDPLTNLQTQPTTHYQQQLLLNRRRSNSSSPSPSTSGRATPASGGAASNASATSSSSSHFQQQPHTHYQQQHNYQYLTQTHNYFHVRAQQQDVDVMDDGRRGCTGGGGFALGPSSHNYMHTFPSTHTPSHLQQHHLLQQQYQHYHQQQPSMAHLMHLGQQQQHSLPPLYPTSQSLTASPLLTKRAISFSGQIPLTRQQMDNLNTASHRQQQQVLQTAQSTPNSPRLMPRRQTKPPPIPAKPSSIPSTSSTTSSSSNATNQKEGGVGGGLNPASSLDGADAPWPHFSTLTDYLDVHQVNNYGQPIPEVCTFVEIRKRNK